MRSICFTIQPPKLLKPALYCWMKYPSEFSLQRSRNSHKTFHSQCKSVILNRLIIRNVKPCLFSQSQMVISPAPLSADRAMAPVRCYHRLYVHCALKALKVPESFAHRRVSHPYVAAPARSKETIQRFEAQRYSLLSLSGPLADTFGMVNSSMDDYWRCEETIAHLSCICPRYDIQLSLSSDNII